MSHVAFFHVATLMLVTILSFGCSKKHDETRASTTSVADAPAIADFPMLDAKVWVNGAPVSLGESRGKHVVLIEAWHPS